MSTGIASTNGRVGRWRGTTKLPLMMSLVKLAAASPLMYAAGQESHSTKHGGVIKPDDPMGSARFWFKSGISVGLVVIGGVFAGLTLALMGSDDMHLRVLAQSSSDPSEKRHAANVLKLLNRGRHWVLVCLLLSNVVVNESLPIFLHSVLGGGVAAVAVSTIMIFIFGEVIPQSICVRYGLSIGGTCAPFVLAMMYISAPITWPIAKALDWALGADEGHTFRKAELKTFLQFHRAGIEPLRDDEITILDGVLSLNDKKASEIMTPIKDVLTLGTDQKLDHKTLDHILLSGFSRIPVHEKGQKDNFIGMLLVKILISYNPEECKRVGDFPLLSLPEARPDINCFQALDYFQTGRAHLLLISEAPGSAKGALGIVSLEDLVEEIIGEEIIDETDRYMDNHTKRAAKRQGTAAVMRGIIERHKNTVHIHSRAQSPSPGEGRLIEIDGEEYTLTAKDPSDVRARGQSRRTSKDHAVHDDCLIMAEPTQQGTDKPSNLDPSERNGKS